MVTCGTFPNPFLITLRRASHLSMVSLHVGSFCDRELHSLFQYSGSSSQLF